jgi:hypothetical protein
MRLATNAGVHLTETEKYISWALCASQDSQLQVEVSGNGHALLKENQAAVI